MPDLRNKPDNIRKWTETADFVFDFTEISGLVLRLSYTDVKCIRAGHMG
jgi:hypothetical protein